MNNSEKKILFVSTQFPPNDSIGTQRIVKFIKYLKRKGWEIYVLTLEEKYYKNSSDSYRVYLPDGIHVFRKSKIDIFGYWDRLKKSINKKNKPSKTLKPDLGSKSYKKGNPDKLSFIQGIKELISNLLQYPDKENGFFFSVFFTAFRYISQYKIPYVFISSPPHSPVIPVTLLRKIINFCYIIDFRDPWARSQWQQKPKYLYQKIEKRLDLFFENQTLQTADVAIFNTDQLKKEFTTYYQNTSIPQKFHFISNGFDPELKFQYSNGRTDTKKNKITLLHTGTLYKRRNPQIIFESLLEFRKAFPEKAKLIELKFIGFIGDELKYLQQYIKDNSLSENIKFHSKLSYDKIIDEMKYADWLLLLQPGTTFQIPAKFYDYLLVDKPIWGVLEKNSVGESAINKLNIGYVSNCHSVESILNFFKFITSKNSNHFTPDRSELQKYSIPFLIDQFEEAVLNHKNI